MSLLRWPFHFCYDLSVFFFANNEYTTWTYALDRYLVDKRSSDSQVAFQRESHDALICCGILFDPLHSLGHKAHLDDAQKHCVARQKVQILIRRSKGTSSTVPQFDPYAS